LHKNKYKAARLAKFENNARRGLTLITTIFDIAEYFLLFLLQLGPSRVPLQESDQSAGQCRSSRRIKIGIPRMAGNSAGITHTS
jgi:hypothetical protein